ncbi:MAG TPA: hypothetical protein VG796_06655 [Verrucomicrobiales bacterium]|nr:hypothetical protein [Verrucomicrobiales bacterium]
MSSSASSDSRQRPARARREDDRPREFSPAWWGFGGVAILLTPVVLYLIFSGNPKVVTHDKEEKTKVAQRLDDGRELHRMMEAFLNASTPEEKAGFVRGGASLLPAMKEWYARHPDEPGGEYRPGPSTASEWIGGREFTLFGGRNRMDDPVETVAENLPEGFRLDWRCLTGAGDMEWEDWLKERPQRAITMRGMARPDGYYDGPFRDESKYFCIKISDPNSDLTVWAYAERAGSTGKSLEERLTTPETTIKLTGSFKFPDSSGRLPQVLAERVGAMGWLDESVSQSPAVKEKQPAR